uniref:translocon-associated protein subunit delta-like n=1 Tax=Hydractinia symbiolongicarpus TaxID=13093 RepID=UPI00254D1D69|nr:translocon-associated protein subunit delta-like [Hydractinia symbiolongicarpus]
MLLVIFVLGLSSALVSSKVCSNPSVSTSTHTSRNVALSTETAYVADITVTCENSMGLNLYAEIEAGVLVPVAYATDTSNYQISWTKDHKKATTGTVVVNIFNEDGYTAYRKVQRNNEDVSKIKPYFTIEIHHPGVAREGLFVQTEFIAVVCALLVWWSANSMRNQIME